MENKKGQSHIEIIISFTLFITFIVFMLFVFRPVVKSGEVSLNSVEHSLKSNLSSNLYFFSVKYEPETEEGDEDKTNADCFCIDNPYPDVKGEIAGRDKAGNPVNAWKSGSSVCTERDGEDFFYIYFSGEFETSSGRCDNSVVISDKNIGLLREVESVSYSSLVALNESYNEDYDGLKTRLRIDHDFRLGVFSSGGEKIFELNRDAPLGRPVYSRDVPIELVYNDSRVQHSIMKIYSW